MKSLHLASRFFFCLLLHFPVSVLQIPQCHQDHLSQQGVYSMLRQRLCLILSKTHGGLNKVKPDCLHFLSSDVFLLPLKLVAQHHWHYGWKIKTGRKLKTCSLHANCAPSKLVASVASCAVIKLHISARPFIVASLRHTWQ